MEIELFLSFAALLLIIFFATIDSAFGQLSDVSLRRLAADWEDENVKAAALLRDILEHRSRFRFAISTILQFLLIGFAVFATLAVARYSGERKEVFAAALVLAFILSIIARQMIPRVFVRTNTEAKLLMMSPLVRPVYKTITWFAAPFDLILNPRETQKIEATITPDSPDDDDNGDDIQALIEVGEAEGILETHERELIETMVDFADTRAGEIMTPRTEVCALPINSTVRQTRDLMIDEKYSRIPVYRDSVDNIEGVIYVRDLLLAWAEGKEETSIEKLVRPVAFVPETKSASDLLKDLQTSHNQFAVVIDEYGGVAGVITVEDIVEEIVGEIEDEDIEDEEVVEIIEGDDGYFEVPGSTDISKIEKMFDLDFEDEDFTTIAGLVTSEVGYIPKDGEKLSFHGLNVEILKADEKKIYQLRLRSAIHDQPS